MARAHLLSVLLMCYFCNAVSELKGTKENDFSSDNGVNSLQESPFIGCSNDSYPPSFWQHIPEYIIDLDKPPEERWVQLITNKKTELLQMLEMMKNNTSDMFGDKVFKLIDTYLPWFTKTLPKEYYDELIGISIASGLPVGEVTIFNIFYEFYSACTSIVMQSSDNRIYLGRNLDFGLFLGWDIENKTWMAPEFLRPLVVRLEFRKQNATVYKSVGFAGYTGILTAVKKDSFALSVNERFKIDGGYVGIAEWLIGRHDQKWIGLLTREIMESAESYSQAQKLLYTPTLVAPVYFILAGRKAHQGCVITRGRTDSDVWSLDNYSNSTDSNGKWFLVQTNYDHWKKPPFYDDRVDPANKCMEYFGADNAEATLYKVLSTRPILNKLTTFTAIMDVSAGDIQSWVRTCEDPCWPW